MVARPGDDVRKHMTASFINKLNRKGRGQPQHIPSQQQSRIVVTGLAGPRLSTNDYIGRFEACNISKLATPEAYTGSNESAWVGINLHVDKEDRHGQTVTKEYKYYKDWGVSQGRIDRQGHSAEVVLSGLTWAYYEQEFEGEEIWGDHVDYRDGKLWKSSSGKGRIIVDAPIPGSGEDQKPGLILLGSDSNQVSLFLAPSGGLSGTYYESDSGFPYEICTQLDWAGRPIGTDTVYIASNTHIAENTVFTAQRIDNYWYALGAGSGATPLTFFRLLEPGNTGLEILAQAVDPLGNILRKPNPDYEPGSEIEPLIDAEPINVINWDGILDEAPIGYIGLFAPVSVYEENLDYQPNPDLPYYDPRAYTEEVVWAFCWGPCVIGEGS